MTKKFTHLQGQYLAFIHAYSKVHRRSPSEGDMRMFFHVTGSTIHQMIQTLEKGGFISKVPHQPRSLNILLPSSELPELE